MASMSTAVLSCATTAPMKEKRETAVTNDLNMTCVMMVDVWNEKKDRKCGCDGL